MLPIRKLVAGDAGRVREFFGQMGGESRSFFNVNSWNEKKTMEFFDEEKRDKNAVYWIALDGDKMAGYVFLNDMNRGIPWLGIAVAEDWKGRGLGKALMEKAREHAISKGKGGILLTTHIANIRGQALYSRCGYERLGIHTGGEVLFLLRF